MNRLSTRFSRLEHTLQLMRLRICSFDSQLVLDQHEKYFRQEYYKCAYEGVPVMRYDTETESMEPEDLTQEFVDYLATTLQVIDKNLSESQMEEFLA